MLLIHHYLLVFRAGSAPTVEVTTTLAPKVTVGVLRSALQSMLGTAAWPTAMGLQAETTSIRKTGSLLGV